MYMHTHTCTPPPHYLKDALYADLTSYVVNSKLLSTLHLLLTLIAT